MDTCSYKLNPQNTVNGTIRYAQELCRTYNLVHTSDFPLPCGPRSNTSAFWLLYKVPDKIVCKVRRCGCSHTSGAYGSMYADDHNLTEFVCVIFARMNN